jgi:hypothetical protein
MKNAELANVMRRFLHLLRIKFIATLAPLDIVQP